MPSDDTHIKLTVYHDGQFWVGLYERDDAGQLSFARVLFGSEPSLPEIEELVAGDSWRRLHFLPAGESTDRAPILAANPKRRQREAAKAARASAPSTRSQDAMKAAIEAQAEASKASAREQKHEVAEERWEHRVAKRKEKKRGH